MKNKVLNTIQKYNMLKKDDSVVVGLSGGADSVALTYLLRELGYNVYACHVNHNLRGAESDSDEEYCKNLCSKLGIKLFVKSADVISQAALEHSGIEETARRIRYDFFGQKADELGAKIATAHTLSDRTETLIFNLVRGSGINGLCSTPPVRDNIVRPLIEVSRGEVEKYCELNALHYVIDSSNLSDDYSRNRIRHRIIPELCRLNPSYLSAFARFFESCAQDAEYIDSAAAEYADECRAKVLSELHPALLSRVIKQKLLNAGVKSDSFRISLVKKVIYENQGRQNLSKNIYARVKGGRLIIGEDIADEYFEKQISEGINEINGRKIILSRKKYISSEKINRNFFYLTVDCDKINGKIAVRQKKDGDKVRINGMTKPLKKIFCEKNMSAAERSRALVVCDELGIIGVVGLLTADRAKISPQTEYYFEIGEV